MDDVFGVGGRDRICESQCAGYNYGRESQRKERKYESNADKRRLVASQMIVKGGLIQQNGSVVQDPGRHGDSRVANLGIDPCRSC